MPGILRSAKVSKRRACEEWQSSIVTPELNERCFLPLEARERPDCKLSVEKRSSSVLGFKDVPEVVAEEGKQIGPRRAL